MTVSNEKIIPIIDFYRQYGKEAAEKKYKIKEETIQRYIRLLKVREGVSEIEQEIEEEEIKQVRQTEDIKNGTSELEFRSKEEIRTLDDLIEKCNIDVSTWNILRYVQNYWGNANNPNWQVKVWLSRKDGEQQYQDSFISFLSTYAPSPHVYSEVVVTNKPEACLVLNKQDAHLNKHDVHGNNDLQSRFDNILNKLDIIVQQSILSNDLDNITYILGSDEFNSEWTGMTTKGTPQQNVGSYQESFEKICEHEIRVINMLISNSKKAEIIFCPGNHDEYAGWTIIKWLEAYFRSTDRVSFDTSPSYRKYISYGNTALMFNHGDAIKPAKLASMFPMEFKNDWSRHEHFYIFTGDKHHELAHDYNGIKFYQIPAFSNAKSLWDEKNGYTCSKAEATGFLIDKVSGMTNIFKQYL